MYIVVLTYTANMADVDAALSEHVSWLDGQYEQQRLLASGRKDPRDGGVLLFASIPREELDAELAKDPFAARGLADYQVVTFKATKTVDALAPWRE